MHASSKTSLTAKMLVFLWPAISISILLAFSATEPAYHYSEVFDEMVATKYALTIVGHILALGTVPAFIYMIFNTRKAKSKGFLTFFIITMVLVALLQCLLRAVSISCIGDGCHSENLPIQFQFLLTLITTSILISESAIIGIIFTKKLS